MRTSLKQQTGETKIMLWIILGLIAVIPSTLVLLAQRYLLLKQAIESIFLQGRDMNDPKASYTYVVSLLSWPTLLAGLALMIPTPVWWDIGVGFFVGILFEFYKWIQAYRHRAEFVTERMRNGRVKP